MNNKKITWLAPLTLALAACQPAGDFPDQDGLCDFDQLRESERAASAAVFPTPVISTMTVNGTVVWEATNPPATPPTLRPNDTVVLTGTGFGNGTDTDFSKIMIGNTRVLETNLVMYKQKLDIEAQVNYETPDILSSWNKDITGWTPTRIAFKVPGHVSSGPLQVQIQKRTGYLESLINPGQPHSVIDALTKRITDDTFQHECDVVSTLGNTKGTAPLAVNVVNTGFATLEKRGREIFWSYDFNIGLAHAVRNLNWKNIFEYKTTDPITREVADPAKLIGAYPTVVGEVPAEAINDVYFNPYPQPNPIPGFLTVQPQLTKGNTKNSGWVGYRYAEASHPYNGPGQWIGFNCASCHSYRVSYEKGGSNVTKVIPGLPNPEWSMKWAVLGNKSGDTTATFDGIEANEEGPSWDPGKVAVDKTALIYFMPAGTGEHNIVRLSDEGSETDNDYQFSPIAIPNITHYMSIRRSLSHTESYVGFEGSYIHAEEPDGATGSMLASELKALTAYMTVLDKDDNDLRNVGLYRWLKHNGKLGTQTGNGSLAEGSFVQNGWQSYPGVVSAVNAGKTIFNRDCGSCHTDTLGSHTSEKMFRLDEVGRFFTPTIYHKDQQSIRATFLRDVYWTQHRGLLTDGHVRNMEDLVNPDRCEEGTDLYNQYYTLHPPASPALGGPDFPEPYPAANRKGDVFRVLKSASTSETDTGAKRNRFIERHKYFVTVPWDDQYYYWDYQKMRAEWGPDEMGTPAPVNLPAAPHPWCAQNASDVGNLVQYVMTL